MPQKITTGGEPGKKIKPLTKYWVCVDKKGCADYSSISYTRNGSMKLCTEGLVQPSWEDFRKRGWRCIKVNIAFTPA